MSEMMSEGLVQKRIYIGGLFPDVSDGELRCRFGKYGDIGSINITVRKDENGLPVKTFAHMDISATEKNLQNCFSLYNKTKWKGSVLKLQLAKEHFLTRLQEEHQAAQNEVPVEKVAAPREPVISEPLADVKEITDFCMRGAVPGTEIPGVKNWVVGKYGRVLPVVNLRKKEQKRLLTVDPSKYVHNVKRMKVDETAPEPSLPPVDSLTWALDSKDTEISRRKQGIFPNWTPKPRPKKTVKEDITSISQWKLESEMELEVVSTETTSTPLLRPSYLSNRQTYCSDSEEEIENCSKLKQKSSQPTVDEDSSSLLFPSYLGNIKKKNIAPRGQGNDISEEQNRVNNLKNRLTSVKDASDAVKTDSKTSGNGSLNRDELSKKSQNAIPFTRFVPKGDGQESIPSNKEGRLTANEPSSKKKNKEKVKKETEKKKREKKQMLFKEKPKKLMEFQGTSMLDSDSEDDVIQKNVLVNQSDESDDELRDNQSVSSADTDEIVSFHKQKLSIKPTKSSATIRNQVNSILMNEFSDGFQANSQNLNQFSNYVLTESEDDDNDFEKIVKQKLSSIRKTENKIEIDNQVDDTDDFEIVSLDKAQGKINAVSCGIITKKCKKVKTITSTQMSGQSNPVMSQPSNKKAVNDLSKLSIQKVEQQKEASISKTELKNERKPSQRKKKESISKTVKLQNSDSSMKDTQNESFGTESTLKDAMKVDKDSVSSKNNKVDTVRVEYHSDSDSCGSADTDELISSKKKLKVKVKAQHPSTSTLNLTGPMKSLITDEFSSGLVDDVVEETSSRLTPASVSNHTSTAVAMVTEESEEESDFESFVKKELQKLNNVKTKIDTEYKTKAKGNKKDQIETKYFKKDSSSEKLKEQDEDSKEVPLQSVGESVLEESTKTSQKADIVTLSGSDLSVKKSARKPQTAAEKMNVDKRRLETVRQRQKENDERKSAIKKALANVDTGTAQNKKIVFADSDSEDDEKAGVVAMETSSIIAENPKVEKLLTKSGEDKHPTLFDDSSDEENQEDLTNGERFRLRPEFEGKAGKKLLKLQSRYDTDDRFKLDARFMESDSDAADNDKEEREELAEEDEKQRSLKILQSVVGKKLQVNTDKKKKFKDISSVRFDPADEKYSALEIKPSDSLANDNKVKENQTLVKNDKKQKTTTGQDEEIACADKEPDAVVLPEVSKERFYEVSDSLTDIFKKKALSESKSEPSSALAATTQPSAGGFSLLAAFGKVTEEEINTDKAVEAYSYKPIKQSEGHLSVEDRFCLDDSSGDDASDNEHSSPDDKLNGPSMAMKASDNTETTSPPVTIQPSSFFFFSNNDNRIKEGQSFCRQEDMDTVREQWSKQRPKLIREFKKKHKNLRRKKQMKMKAAKGKPMQSKP